MTVSCTPVNYDTVGVVCGYVCDKDSSLPIENASIMLNPSGITRISGSDGYFEFQDLTPRQYTITVQKNGYRTNRKSVTVIAGEGVELNIPISKYQ